MQDVYMLRSFILPLSYFTSDVNQENKDNDGCRGNELVLRREEASDEEYFKVRFLYNRKFYAILSAVTN